MFGDDDPDVAHFFAHFLGEGPDIRIPPPLPRRDGRIRPTRYNADIAPLTNGLAVGLSGAAAILNDTAAPHERVRSDRAETFHRMLEDMANDIMLNGLPVHVAVSREATPRSRSSSPPAFAGWPVEDLADPLPQRLQSDEVEQLDESSVDSSDEDISDVRYPPMDFGASVPVPDIPPNHIRLVVSSHAEQDRVDGSWPTREVLAKIVVDLDSSVEELFTQIESTIGEHDIPEFITRSGLKVERADLPLKWSGLHDGDVITCIRSKPQPQQRLFEVVTASHDTVAAKGLGLGQYRLPEPDVTPVSMGAFGDAIAQAAVATGSSAVTGAYPSTGVSSARPPLPSHWNVETIAEEDASSELPDHWGFSGLGLTTAIQNAELDLNVVPPIPPSSEASDVRPMPTPPDCMLDEFEDLPADAFITPHNHASSAQGASQQLADVVSPSKPPRKVAASPPHPSSAALAATTPTSSRLSDLSCAPTPSRKTEEFKKKLEEKQKANDAIWANIAATLEPSQQRMAERTFLSHTVSGSGLGKKFPPVVRR